MSLLFYVLPPWSNIGSVLRTPLDRNCISVSVGRVCFVALFSFLPCRLSCSLHLSVLHRWPSSSIFRLLSLFMLTSSRSIHLPSTSGRLRPFSSLSFFHPSPSGSGSLSGNERRNTLATFNRPALSSAYTYLASPAPTPVLISILPVPPSSTHNPLASYVSSLPPTSYIST